MTVKDSKAADGLLVANVALVATVPSHLSTSKAPIQEALSAMPLRERRQRVVGRFGGGRTAIRRSKSEAAEAISSQA
jgi:hypothetical protein